MFSSEHAPAIKTASKVQWPLRFAFSCVRPNPQRYMRKTVEEVLLQRSSHLENMTIRALPTVNFCLESAAAITLRFQLCSARYKQRTVLESSQQSVCSPQKIRTIPVYKRTVRKPCIALPQINTLGCQQKEMGHKGGQR